MTHKNLWKNSLCRQVKKKIKIRGKKTYRKFKMLSLNKFRSPSAEPTDSNCILALHDCADHLEDPDRKRCKREGLAERGGGGGGGGANCHQRKRNVWLWRQEPPSRAVTHTNTSCNFCSPQKCLCHPGCAGKHPGGRRGRKGEDSWQYIECTVLARWGVCGRQ